MVISLRVLETSLCIKGTEGLLKLPLLRQLFAESQSLKNKTLTLGRREIIRPSN